MTIIHHVSGNAQDVLPYATAALSLIEEPALVKAD